MTKAKAPFQYCGGKQRLAKHILPLIPRHTVYVEPFCGAASVFFSKRLPESSSYLEVLNDKDEAIFNFFKCLQDEEKFNKLLRRLEYTPHSRKEFQLSRNLDVSDPVELAARFFVNRTQSFAGGGTGFGVSVFSSFSPHHIASKVNSLREFSLRLKKATIECLDAIDVIKKYDSPHTFFYCDPPYPSTVQKYRHKFSEEDFRHLVGVLNSCQGSFILSCYGFDYAPSDWEVFTFDSYCHASGTGKTLSEKDRTRKQVAEKLGNRKKTEYIYRRLNRVEPREEILKLYATGKFDSFV